MEVPTLSGIRDKLADMAAADAAHDFTKPRGSIFEFTETYGDNKNIGTPTLPSGELLDEHGTLNTFLNYYGQGQKSNAIAHFREKFLREGFTTNIPRASDDPVNYEVSSIKISSRISKSKNNKFTVTPSQFMDFLTAGTGRDVAFCIDAENTDFYDIFKVPESGVAKRTAYFVTPREGINDGASKTIRTEEEELTESGEYSVKVQNLEDSYAGDIVYKATDLSDSSIETFYSIFNISLSPIDRSYKIPAIRVTYSKGGYSEPSDLIFQNSKSDTSNTAKALGRRISSFLKRMVGADYNAYYKMLQRKRSGDWLQVLACLDRKRFQMPDIPIILCTQDIICAAYAYAMGVDVIFMHIWRPDGTNITENWLLYFRKKIDGDTVPEELRVARTIAGLPKPVDSIPALLEASYLDVRTTFIGSRTAAIEGLRHEFEPIVAEVEAADTEATIEAAIKSILSVYARLVGARASLPTIEAKGEESLDSLASVSRYETQLSIFKQILKGKSGDMKELIAANINRIVERVRGGGELKGHIDRISIFGSFMSIRRNRETGLREHSTGLLKFMRDYLTAEERDELVRVLKIPLAKLAGVNLDKYKVFLEAIETLIEKKGNGPKVPNWVLVEAVIADVIEEPVGEYSDEESSINEESNKESSINEESNKEAPADEESTAVPPVTRAVRVRPTESIKEQLAPPIFGLPVVGALPPGMVAPDTSGPNGQTIAADWLYQNFPKLFKTIASLGGIDPDTGIFIKKVNLPLGYLASFPPMVRKVALTAIYPWGEGPEGNIQFEKAFGNPAGQARAINLIFREERKLYDMIVAAGGINVDGKFVKTVPINTAGHYYSPTIRRLAEAAKLYTKEPFDTCKNIKWHFLEKAGYWKSFCDPIITGGGTQEPTIELSSTYGPSVILALRFQNKQERNHRVEDLEGRRHSAMTTPILFMHKLVIAMQRVQDNQSSDPEYSANNEYMLQYISQWLAKILRALPGTDTKKEYRDIECFLLGMIFEYESDMKNSADYIRFLEAFVMDTYGTSLREYRIRLCPHIAMEPFVFQEGVPYSALIDDLKSLIRITLGKLRSYEEDPRRLVELHEKEARVAAAARLVEETDRAVAAAEAADTVARATVSERVEEAIASRAALQAAADSESALAAEADRAHRSAERARFKMGIAQNRVKGVVHRAVARASNRGAPMAMKATKRYGKLSKAQHSRKKGSDDFSGVTRRKVHPA